MRQIIINEAQSRFLLTEEIADKLSSKVKQTADYGKNLVKQISDVTKLDLRFLLTWGAAIGGFMKPLDDLISGKYPEIGPMNKIFILSAVLLTYFFENKELLSKITKKIKESGFGEILLEVISKAETLRNAFGSFLESLSLTVGRVSNMMAYTFLIPILPIIIDLGSNFELANVEELVKRILSYGVVLMSGFALRDLLGKLGKRLSR